MSIFETLKNVKDSGFDASTDSTSTNSKLPAGRYPVRLKSAENSQSTNGYEQVAVGLEVVSGKYKDRQEFIYWSFGSTLPDFVLEKNGRELLKLAEMTGVKFTQQDLQTEESTAKALQRGLGKQFLMNLELRENKKNPDYPYRNYDFEKLENENNDFDSFNQDDVGEVDIPF